MTDNEPSKPGSGNWFTETVRIAAPRWVLVAAGLVLLLLVLW